MRSITKCHKSVNNCQKKYFNLVFNIISQLQALSHRSGILDGVIL